MRCKMADFTKLDQSLRYVSALPDRPSLAEGYTAEAVKEVFDRAAEEIKTYINDVLIRELTSFVPGDSCSEKLGSRPVTGVEGNTVYQQISHIAEMIRDITLASIPDNSITAEKLEPLLRARIETLSLGDTVYKTAGTYTFTVPRSGIYRIILCGGGAAGSLYSHDQSKVNSTHYGFGGASGAYGEFTMSLEEGEEIPVEVGAGGQLKTPCILGQMFDGSDIDFSEQPGKASTFGLLRAEGGCGYSVLREEATAKGGGMTLYKNGKAQPGSGYSHDGLESFIGNGARRVLGDGLADCVYEAGIGGGGCGYVYSDDVLNVAGMPQEERMYYLNKNGTAGGDGIVIVRYMQTAQ